MPEGSVIFQGVAQERLGPLEAAGIDVESSIARVGLEDAIHEIRDGLAEILAPREAVEADLKRHDGRVIFQGVAQERLGPLEAAGIDVDSSNARVGLEDAVGKGGCRAYFAPLMKRKALLVDDHEPELRGSAGKFAQLQPSVPGELVELGKMRRDFAAGVLGSCAQQVYAGICMI
ncbi:hypothetical protein V5799_017474 [Amblyomma americanum]|uniref:Uncharacterized protein n=1 Tax=Amblyomma americanum TaxID=6943 RepID=A0AAQ4F363_AMBAM